MSVVCLIPADLDHELAVALEQEFGAAGVHVVREQRKAERRTAPRRDSGPPPIALADRRRVRNEGGRRIADRRGQPVAVPGPAGVAHIDARVQFFQHEPLDERRREVAEGLRLVVRFQLGDRDAFRDIYDRSFDAVYRYLMTALRDAHEAEDGAQEIFMRALRALPRYEFRGVPFEAWLFRIVRNYTLSHKARQAPVTPADPVRIDRWREDRSMRSQAGVAAASDPDLMALLERMPLPQRQVIVLRYMVGLDWNEIAAALERSSGAVRQLEQRALAFLRQRLEAIESASASRTRPLPMRRQTWASPVSSGRRSALLYSPRAA